MKVAASTLALLALFGTGTGSAQSAELVPLSYTFDQATDCGTWCYPDSGGELTDGVYGARGWGADLGQGNAAEWVGWYQDTTVNVDFDFGEQVSVSSVSVGTTQDHVEDVVFPSVTIYRSDDASQWDLVANLDVPESSLNDQNYLDPAKPHAFLVLDNLGINSARYVRVSLAHSFNGPWTFTDEIDFVGAPVPEPATYALILGGLGLLGWATRRRRS